MPYFRRICAFYFPVSGQVGLLFGPALFGMRFERATFADPCAPRLPSHGKQMSSTRYGTARAAGHMGNPGAPNHCACGDRGAVGPRALLPRGVSSPRCLPPIDKATIIISYKNIDQRFGAVGLHDSSYWLTLDWQPVAPKTGHPFSIRMSTNTNTEKTFHHRLINMKAEALYEALY